jgi:hypothetical protein
MVDWEWSVSLLRRGKKSKLQRRGLGEWKSVNTAENNGTIISRAICKSTSG